MLPDSGVIDRPSSKHLKSSQTVDTKISTKIDECSLGINMDGHSSSLDPPIFEMKYACAKSPESSYSISHSDEGHENIPGHIVGSLDNNYNSTDFQHADPEIEPGLFVSSDNSIHSLQKNHNLRMDFESVDIFPEKDVPLHLDWHNDCVRDLMAIYDNHDILKASRYGDDKEDHIENDADVHTQEMTSEMSCGIFDQSHPHLGEFLKEFPVPISN